MGKDADQKDKAQDPPRGAAHGAMGSRIEALRTAGTVGTVGLSFVFAILIGGAVGWWLDDITGWSPVFFGVFLVLGLLAGLRNVYVILKRFLR